MAPRLGSVGRVREAGPGAASLHQNEVLPQVLELSRALAAPVQDRGRVERGDHRATVPVVDLPAVRVIPCEVCRTNFVAKLPSVTMSRGWIRRDRLDEPGRAGLDLVGLGSRFPGGRH